jgi:hypothetical protein
MSPWRGWDYFFAAFIVGCIFVVVAVVLKALFVF